MEQSIVRQYTPPTFLLLMIVRSPVTAVARDGVRLYEHRDFGGRLALTRMWRTFAPWDSTTQCHRFGCWTTFAPAFINTGTSAAAVS